jgi:hypothetical protein
MLSDGTTNSAATDPGYVHAYNNIVSETSNYGIAINAGHDDLITNNIVIATGTLPNGTKIAAQNVGIYIWNGAGDPYFNNNQSYGNTIDWMGPSGRNDAWYPDGSGQLNDDTRLAANMTLAVEASYFASWAQRVALGDYSIGA